ncbi:MAG: N-acetylmannosamine-6-phosphate 2-epimerase [Lachnospiraceae bacterium]|jgi:N-acylglucosamine-6-phosphate 2-epimerase|uniref:N-acetylmannosamine-6-phosphate 2-epimerase n=1 Tax=Candidatus Merdisoma sp. JLR.KK006 TaxID=3112626 RepID=UPI002FF2E703|nr:N-acetylmannosamine-6-phosphate 2-epimerase [Lachnospiraceae bacterium]
MREKQKKLIESLSGELVVSCQAFAHEPLYSVDIMVKLAIAAHKGGAGAIRASWPENISAIRKNVDLPIFGINKIMPEHYNKMRDVVITPTLKAAQAVYYAGADIIAVDATLRGGRTKEDIKGLLREIKENLDVLVMGEVSTLEEGLLAEDSGADIVSTTIAGYTDYSRQLTEPDYELIEELVSKVKLPVNAEGRFHRPEQVKRAFSCGAWTVTVGSAITRPHFITEQFVKGMK